MSRFIYFIIIGIIPLQAFATKGPYFFQSKTGNVETLIAINDISSFEIEKTALIGKLCDSYLQNSKFKDVPVFIFYLSAPCRGNNASKYFLSYDKGRYSLKNTINKNKKGKLLSKPGIVIRLLSSNINPRTILNLLEFGLQNIELLKKNQTKVSSGYWSWNSIDTTTIKSYLKTFSLTPKIDSVLSLSFNIKSNFSDFQVSWRKEEYYLGGKENQQILLIPNIINVINLDSISTLVFDSEKTFYHVNLLNNKASGKLIINESKSKCFKSLAIKDDSLIYLTNDFYFDIWRENLKFDQFNFWRFSTNDDKIENVTVDRDYLIRLLESESKHRLDVKIDIQKKN
jgi:hypothetical protein